MNGMDKSERLLAMRQAMMTGRPVAAPSVAQAARSQPAQRQVSAGQMIAALKGALAAERRARLAAEARLRSVLAELAQRPTPAAFVERPRLPAPEPVTIEAEVVEEGASLYDRINAIGGDDDGQEIDDG